MQNMNNGPEPAKIGWKVTLLLFLALNIITIGVPQSILLSGGGYSLIPYAVLLAPLFYAGIAVALLNVVVITIYLLRQKPKLAMCILWGLVAIASAVYFGHFALQII